jgi:predicted ester cyclase
VACRLVFDCTPVREFLGFTPDGSRLRFAEHVFYDFRDGRIAAVTSMIDRAAIAAQLSDGKAGSGSDGNALVRFLDGLGF